MAKLTKEQRYAKGYLPKIMYWAEQLYNAAEEVMDLQEDTDRIANAKAKLDYFYNRHQRALAIDKIIEGEQGTISDVPQDYKENKHFHKETFDSVSSEVENEHSKYQKTLTPKRYNAYVQKQIESQVIWGREQEEEENCMSPIELKRYQNKIDNHNF